MPFTFPKEKINILLLENISEEAANRFIVEGYTNVTRIKQALGEEELKKALKQVHILGIRSKTKLTAAVLEAAPKLLGLGCYCIGTNQVDKHAATLLGIPVFNAPYSNTRSVAELVIGAAIMLIRRIPDKNAAAHKGIWMKEASGSHELRGKTLGIIGYGNIGSQVSVLAEGMGLKVIFYDVAKKLPLGNANAMLSQAEVLKQADIITIHVPSAPDTQHLMDAAAFAQCKKGALFINYARGEVVDINALAKALKSDKLAGVAVDVYPTEPEQNGPNFITPLQGLSNVLLTPHIGGSTEEAQVAIGDDVSAKLLRFIENGGTEGSQSIPELNLPRQEGAHRILHLHHNQPGVLSAINKTLAEPGINVVGQYLKTNEQIGYVVLDVDKKLSEVALKLLQKVPGTVRVRMVY